MITVGLGFVLGFLIGLTGVGGGALIAPALYVVLGLSYQEAVSLSLIYALITKIISAVQHVRQRTVLWRITLLYGGLGIPGAVLGSQLLYWAGSATDRIFPFVMSGVLLIVAGLLLLETAGASRAERRKPFSAFQFGVGSVATVAVIQLFVGVLLGATSIGSGSIIIVSMLYLFRMSAQEVVGSNIVIALIMAAPAWLTHYAAGGLDWSLLGLLMIGSAVGAVLGAKATMVLGGRQLKLAIAALITIGAVATLVKAWPGS